MTEEQSVQAKIKAGVVLESLDVNAKPTVISPSFDLDATLSPTHQLDDNDMEAVEASVEQTSGNTKRWLFWTVLLTAALGTAELVRFIQQVVAEDDWLSGLWLLPIGMVAALAIRTLVSEWRGLKRLKKRQQQMQLSEELATSPTIGQGRGLCQNLAQQMAVFNPQITQYEAHWQSQLAEFHNDKEVLQLFEQQVLAPIDRQALQLVSHHAKACAALIAVSPFAALDMGIVLWRNLRMLQQISRLYGLQLGYAGRVQLIRELFKTMVYAGAAEIVTDTSTYALGMGITGKLSASLAQGLGAGVLTARLGLRCINASRPLPWLTESKPKLADISMTILTSLKASESTQSR